MIEREEINMKGELTITKTDINGVVETRTIPNLVVTAGKTYMISRMIGNTPAVMSHMGVGSATAAAVITDTDLGAAISSRVFLTSSTQATTTVTYVATFAAGVSTGAITEAGIFNAATDGSMLAHTVFPVVNKLIGDSISISWAISIS